jgi:phosphate:Na+ symporter
MQNSSAFQFLAIEPLDVAMLIQLTTDRGSMMEKLRSRLQVAEDADVTNVAALHYATTLFERNVWLLRQLALWIGEDEKLSAG